VVDCLCVTDVQVKLANLDFKDNKVLLDFLDLLVSAAIVDLMGLKVALVLQV